MKTKNSQCAPENTLCETSECRSNAAVPAPSPVNLFERRQYFAAEAFQGAARLCGVESRQLRHRYQFRHRRRLKDLGNARAYLVRRSEDARMLQALGVRPD